MAPRYVYLTDITQTPLRMEGMLYDRLEQREDQAAPSPAAPTTPSRWSATAGQIRSSSAASCASTTGSCIYQVDLVIPESLGRTPGVARPDKAELEKLVADKVVGADEREAGGPLRGRLLGRPAAAAVVNVGFSDRNRFTVDLRTRPATPPEDDDEEGAPIKQRLPVEVLRGKVILRDEGYVYVLPEERYYELPLGASIEDSLTRSRCRPRRSRN